MGIRANIVAVVLSVLFLGFSHAAQPSEPAEMTLGRAFALIAKMSCEEAKSMVYRTLSTAELSEEDTRTMGVLHTYAIVSRCALNKRTDAEIYAGQLRGMVGALEDPHSDFLEQEKVAEMDESRSGEFFGIGAELEQIKSGGRFAGARIVSPLPDTPAERAGLKAKDVILAIGEKKTVSYKDLNAVVRDIKGPGGTEVKLTILREGVDLPFVVTIVRGKIVTVDVKSKRLPGDWALIKLSQFESENVCADIKKQYDALERKSPVKGIVLDLRNNPGGLLSLAICVSSQFAPESLRGKFMLSEETRDGVAPIASSTFGDGNAPMDIQKGKPLVVLVNGGSASASEIVAKVCQGFGFCVVAGERTFGKGSIQQVFSIANGKIGVKVTYAQYLVFNSSGVLMPVQGIGVIPNILVKEKSEDKTKVGFDLRESDLGGSIATSTAAKNIPPINTKEADPELYRMIVEALSAPELKLKPIE